MEFKYRSTREVFGAKRSVVMSRNGMVASSHPLASLAGIRILTQGGNAVDAAIAVAAVLNVVEPNMTGIGGDVFALIYWRERGELKGLNASGRSPYASTPGAFLDRGMKRIPERGILSVTVPGALDGWVTLLERYGSVAFPRLLEPAITYAEEGFPVTEIISGEWRTAIRELTDFPGLLEHYSMDGHGPNPGQVWRNPNLARTFKAIGLHGKAAFYEGEIAKAIVSCSKACGGLLEERDLRDHASSWVDPISTTYRGYTLCELPPNGQGLVAIQMLNIMEGYDIQSMGPNSPDYLHLLVEAKKLAFADRDRYVSDPEFGDIPVEKLISKEYAEAQRGRITMKRASLGVNHVSGMGSDTTYLCVVDKRGNMVSFINSIFQSFGSAVVAGDTGIILQNRGTAFSLDERHFNRLEPHKRPLHTIIPAMVFKKEKPFMAFGVMGADMQPQGHVQVLINLVDFGMNIQDALEAPRVRHLEGMEIILEEPLKSQVSNELERRGHRILQDDFQTNQFGGGQGIIVDPDSGVLLGGSDPRKDGCALGY
jgi:gamma-glutamyltranspeptidase/glutathione hydrolase